MKKKLYLSTLAWILTNFLLTGTTAQQAGEGIRLKNGTVKTMDRVKPKLVIRETLKAAVFNKKAYTLIQFDNIPDAGRQAEMAARGIKLTGFHSGKTYYAEIADSLYGSDLQKFNISGISYLSRDMKIDRALQKKMADNRFKSSLETPVAVTYSKTITSAEARLELEKLGAKILITKFRLPNVLFIQATTESLKRIADLPFVDYLSEQSFNDVPINYNNKSFHGVGALSSSFGRNLEGKGVAIGIGDNSNPFNHVDFTNRVIIRTWDTLVRNHGTHTTGTLAGAGIVNPLYKGMAPKATIIAKFISDILVDAPVYINDNNMVLTNNSYYTGQVGCPGNGGYDFLSYYVDYQLNFFPSLMHVFASGNDGYLGGGAGHCAPYLLPFGTIKSGFQCSKNVLTVGNLDPSTLNLNQYSSCGPLDDGRLKPEIVAGGTNVTSTYPFNTYGTTSGTSMSAPTVTGTMALLYERYRQLNYGSDPNGALIKAIVCNTANDLGNPGPDFKFGFGSLNARKAVETIEKAAYVTNQVGNGGSYTFSIPVSSPAQQLKVMLYWSDRERSSPAPASLINNLNLTVTTPSSVVRYPLVPDHTPGNVNNNATEKVDNLNNIEQVVINSPATGSYTVNVTGASIPMGTQQFFVVYEITEPSVTLEYPFGSETLVPGETETIRWSAEGGAGNTFTLEYSLDNGGNWTVIDNAISDATRSYAWTVPSTASNTARVRITRNTAGYSDMSDYPFSILGQPVISSINNPCQGYAGLTWNSITGATSYDIMMLKGDSMEAIASTASTNYIVHGLDKSQTCWFSVRAVNGSVPGRRAVAVSIRPSGGACSLSDFDNDMSIDSLLMPASGRLFTSSELSATENIQVRLQNMGNVASSGSFDISYQINGGSVITESVSPSMSGHSSVNHTFATTYNFSTAGAYVVRIWVSYPSDRYRSNDTLTTIVKQLENAEITLSPSFTEGFETATGSSHISKITGIDGLDRGDFNNNNSNGRLRTYVNSGFARTGNRCATLDQVFYNGTTSTDSLTLTFNLSSYTTANNILLRFYYKNHGTDFTLPGNKVWIRGSETSDWIEVFTLPVTTGDIGGYRLSPAINVTDALAHAAPVQNFSASFQIRFGQSGYRPANSPDAPGIGVDNGFSFDDIILIRTLGDLSVTNIQLPVLPGVCTLSSTETIRVTVRNSSTNGLTNVPISYEVDGNTETENISYIAPSTTLTYTFSAPANLSAFKNYQLRVWTDYTDDTFHGNDTASATFQTSPVIASFPYQEGFESSNGYWYTGGINSSWAWGTPAKPIITAAASGAKAWVTSLDTNYNSSEHSFLYSPCYNLSALTNPTLAFSHISQVEDCGADICDKHWAEYSTDDINWIRLGAQGTGQNWYDHPQNVWKASNTVWHQSIIGIPVKPAKIRFRFVMDSDPAGTYKGVGIDNIRLFDSSATVLPLTLLSFTAVKANSNGLLTWNTLDEMNSDKFIVQKSPNGFDFKDIGTVIAVNSGSANYRFTDYNLVNGKNIYRLKMMDKDGRYAWSPVRTINFNTKGSDISIYPNPVTKGLLYIDASVNCNRIELADISGRVLKTQQVTGLKHTLSVAGITRGTYFMSVITADGKKTKRILID